jgi:septum formation protein
MAPGTDETAEPHEPPAALVARLARAKASAVAAQQPGAWVIGSDQLAAGSDQTGAEYTLGKPGTETHCIEQLRSSSGRSIVFLTAVALMHQESGSLFEFTDTTRVRFRDLDRATIERYVAKERPLDCAGGFKSEGLGVTLCESIDSTDPSALIGLPLIRLSAALRAAGFEVP